MRADLVFRGGSVFHALGRRSTDTVAVIGGRIAAIGADADDLVGPATDVVDLTGRLLVPGFQDAHVHPVSGGIERLTCDLTPYTTEAGYLEAIAAYANANPDLEWIVGGGWSLSSFPGGLPRRERLDEIVGNRAVYLPNRDHHDAWVSSRALELAGVDRDTPDSAFGRIERDPDGSPTGALHEDAMDLVGRLIPTPTNDENIEGLLEAQAYLHSFGVTAWQDALLGSFAEMTDASAAYRDCADDGRLTAKVVGALWWFNTRGADQIDDLVERRERYSGGNFRTTSVKIMQDGICENFTAAMIDPYLGSDGRATANDGISMVAPDELCEHVTELDRRGFQVHVHAIGDRAVREALDAFEAARTQNGDNDLRHHIAHIQVIHPDDVPRFAELGVTGNMQSLWACHEAQMDDLTIPFLGPERSTWQYPFGGLLKAGARLCAGSDWPVSSPDPLWAMHVAVNRQAPAGLGDLREPLYPEQALDVETALSAYTEGSAFVNHLDDTGRIEVGMAADLAVIDRDILAGPSDEIGDGRIDATYVDGKCVFSR
ncbi:MAG TPA: amidohydrolase [Nocardioidaceae bacterium]|nr:amidohydrolase [Nocardioidaceae bacterium]